MKKGHGVDANIIVDGTAADKLIFKSFGKDSRVLGFAESKSKTGKLTVRKFMFEKKMTTEESVFSVHDGSGAIVVKVSTGKISWKKRKQKDKVYSLNTVDSKISEKEAVKARKSMKVATNGDRTTVKFGRAVKFRCSKKEGRFTILIREQFWLQSRHIARADGTPWTPNTDFSSIDLTSDAEAKPTDGPSQENAKHDDEHLAKLENSGRVNEVANPDLAAEAEADVCDAPPKKRIKREKRLPKIKDSIDLTVS